MIALLKGVVHSLSQTKVIVEANGVGYMVHCSKHTLENISAKSPIELYIQTIYRENDVQLYGFIDISEKELFNYLINVQGVGCKHAMAILTIGTPSDIVNAIIAGDQVILTKADGVGPKLASRIINELKSKLQKQGYTAQADQGREAGSLLQSSVTQDAVSALINLGFSRGEAIKKVTVANENAPTQELDLNELVKESLKVS